MVDKKWGNDPRCDPLLMESIWRCDELELIQFEIHLELYLYHLEEAKELSKGDEGVRRIVQ